MKTRLRLMAGVIAPPVVLVAFAVGLAQHPEHDLVTDTVSKLSARGIHDPWAMATGFVLYGLLMVIFATGLRRDRSAVAYGFGTHGILMVLTGVFRDDPTPYGWSSFIGAVHDIVGGMAFTALLVAMVLVAATAEPRRRRTHLVFASVFLLSGLGFLALTIAYGNAYAGISELWFMIVGMAWVQAVTLDITRHHANTVASPKEAS